MPSTSACRLSVTLTAHARQRSQQRAISAEVLDVLLDHGVRVPAGGGAEIVHLTGRTRRACAEALGPVAWRGYAHKLMSAYAVIGADGTVITLGHRVRRITRH